MYFYIVFFILVNIVLYTYIQCIAHLYTCIQCIVYFHTVYCIILSHRYTYWTLSYALTRRGMTKLLSQDPIAHMLPVDEYLPIMFDSHDK